jgi:hypothetical protein
MCDIRSAPPHLRKQQKSSLAAMALVTVLGGLGKPR